MAAWSRSVERGVKIIWLLNSLTGWRNSCFFNEFQLSGSDELLFVIIMKFIHNNLLDYITRSLFKWRNRNGIDTSGNVLWRRLEWTKGMTRLTGLNAVDIILRRRFIYCAIDAATKSQNNFNSQSFLLANRTKRSNNETSSYNSLSIILNLHINNIALSDFYNYWSLSFPYIIWNCKFRSCREFLMMMKFRKISIGSNASWTIWMMNLMLRSRS